MSNPNLRAHTAGDTWGKELQTKPTWHTTEVESSPSSLTVAENNLADASHPKDNHIQFRSVLDAGCIKT